MPMVEVFNLFNVTNILGTTTLNYSGFANALVRDSNDPASPGYLTLVGVRHAGPDRRRRIRVGRPVRPAVRRPRVVLTAPAMDAGREPGTPDWAVAGDGAGRRPHHRASGYS